MAIVIPSSIYQATPTEKAQLYNSLLAQGYSDEEIRIAAGAPRDDNWALLQSIAQSLQPAESLLGARDTNPDSLLSEQELDQYALQEAIYQAPMSLLGAPEVFYPSVDDDVSRPIETPFVPVTADLNQQAVVNAMSGGDGWRVIEDEAPVISPAEQAVVQSRDETVVAEVAPAIVPQTASTQVQPALLDVQPQGTPQQDNVIQSLLAEPAQTQQTSRPTAVLFGDSMSEYVGYTADGNPDNKYGNSVADVISNNLGIQVTNLATGGETSNEALAGGSKFGAFQTYIEQNKPQYAIIRYGAADAIKNQDPATTLQSVQQMVDIAKANGVTPIIVGVSELYGAQNSKTGNIAGYIDPGAEKRASQINDGLKQIAQSAGVSFTDVRAATSAGTGDLLDGVHSNADFGKKMADAISEDIAAKGVIAEAKVPSLPANVDSLSNAEKGRLYNDLIGQGFTDAQIRTAARAESDQDWNALKQIAADVKNITPAQVEKQVQSSAAPEGLLSTKTEAPVASRFSGLFATGDVLANKAQEVLAASGKANDPRFADAIVGSFTQNGINYNVLGDGSMQGVIETPTGAYLSAGFTPTGQQATEELSTQFEQTSTDRLLGTLANAAIAAGTAAGLGPAGVGLMSVPAAAATGAGFTTFANSGDLAQALRAAALGGAAAFGIEQLFPGLSAAPVDDFVSADVARLAAQGIPEDQIAQILTQEGISGNVINAALDAQFGVSAPGSAKGLGFPSAASGAPQVSVTAPTSLLSTAPTAAATGGLLNAPSNVVSALPSIQVTGKTVTGEPFDTTSLGLLTSQGLPTVPAIGSTQSTTIEGARTTPESTTTTLPGAVGSLVSSAPSQQVITEGTKLTNKTEAPAAATAIATQQTVPIESRTIKTETPSILAPAAATVITTPRGEVPVTTYEVPRSSTGPIEGSTTVNPLLALGLLGLAGTALGGGGSTAAPFDQAAYDAIARGRSPVYPRGQFTPISLGGLPGMGGMGEMGAYDYFGPYYGAGRFGARPQAFALPGLLGPNTGLMATPSRSAAV